MAIVALHLPLVDRPENPSTFVFGAQGWKRRLWRRGWRKLLIGGWGGGIVGTVEGRGAVKGNQSSLRLAVGSAFAPADALQAAGRHQSAIDPGHGRLVHRECWVAHNDGRGDPAEWPGGRTLGWVKTTRIEDGKVGDTEHWHYINSRCLTVTELAEAVRGDWGMENSLHWPLDVTFGEGARTVKKDRGPENVSLMNKIVQALLELAPPSKSPRKLGLRRRRLMAAWDDDACGTPRHAPALRTASSNGDRGMGSSGSIYAE